MESHGLGLIGRVFKDTRRAARRFGPPWVKGNGQDGPVWPGPSGRSQGAKGRSAKETEEGRGKRRLLWLNKLRNTVNFLCSIAIVIQVAVTITTFSAINLLCIALKTAILQKS